jgi:hypothetical protein
VSKRGRLGLTPDLPTRWATENNNFVYSSLWGFKSYFTCRKILRHGTFPLYFPSERKVCCGFLSPLKIHPLGRVLNPKTLGPVASTLTTSPPRRLFYKNNDTRSSPCHAPNSSKSLSRLHVSGTYSSMYPHILSMLIYTFHIKFDFNCILTSDII